MVEDDFHVAQTLSRILKTARTTEVVGSLAQARRLLTSGRHWAGLIIDIGLPDGSGLDLVELARSNWPLMPVLILTGRTTPSLVNRAHALGAEFLCKPGSELHVRGFLRRALALERVPDKRISQLLDELAAKSGLTSRETELVAVAIAHPTREALREQLGVSQNTLKSQIKMILRKTEHATLDELVRTVLRDALLGSEVVRGG